MLGFETDTGRFHNSVEHLYLRLSGDDSRPFNVLNLQEELIGSFATREQAFQFMNDYLVDKLSDRQHTELEAANTLRAIKSWEGWDERL